MSEQSVLVCDFCGSSCADVIGLTMIGWDRLDGQPSARLSLGHKPCYPDNDDPWMEAYTLGDLNYVEHRFAYFTENRVFTGRAMQKLKAIAAAVQQLKRNPSPGADLKATLQRESAGREPFFETVEDQPDGGVHLKNSRGEVVATFASRAFFEAAKFSFA